MPRCGDWTARDLRLAREEADHLPLPRLAPEERVREDAELEAYLQQVKERDARVEAERRRATWNDRTPTPALGTETMREVVEEKRR
jgi:hypothetical protein